MSDLIRRIDVIETIEDLLESPYANRGDVISYGIRDALIVVRLIMSRLPAVDAVEVVHGEWGKDPAVAECMNCRTIFPAFLRLHPWCPNCGARMDGKEEEHGH